MAAAVQAIRRPAASCVQRSVRSALAVGPIVLQSEAVSVAAHAKPRQSFGPLPRRARRFSDLVGRDRKLKVACFGSRSLGSPVARLLGQALLENREFEEELMMWVRDEDDGESLADIINSTHENPKYMPGLSFSPNVKATCDAKLAAAGADILVFVLHQGSMRQVMEEIKGAVKDSATVVIMSKESIELAGGQLVFASHMVEKALNLKTAVLTGGTLIQDLAEGHVTEATLGCDDAYMSKQLLKLFNRPNFSVSCVPAVQSVELFAMLKTVVALASGFCDGLGYGANTKSAIVRLGAVEIERFAKHLYPNENGTEALRGACGWNDLIVSAFGDSRNRMCAQKFVKEENPAWEQIGAEFLQVREAPAGVRIAEVAASFIKSRGWEAEFPFICKVHNIAAGKEPVESLTGMVRAPDTKPSSGRPLKVAIMGSGNWGSAVAKIVGENVQTLPDFDEEVRMWVFEEMVEGKKLTEIINTQHRNVKYLPHAELPPNLIAVPDAVEAARDADVLVFVLPHQFLDRLLDQVKHVVKPTAMAVSMIKGHIVVQDGGASMRTGSQVIAEQLGLSGCSVLNGANVANDVASGNFAEATLGCADDAQAVQLQRMFNTPQFSVRTTSDVLGVELFGGLKNVVALAAGFSDGLGLAPSTKAAVLRHGLLEMEQFVRAMCPGYKAETVMESCGVADLLTTCYSGRNRKCAEAFALDDSQTWEDVERELLNGQKLQGPSACYDFQALIDYRNLRPTFPLLSAVHSACVKKLTPRDVFIVNGFLPPSQE